MFISDEDEEEDDDEDNVEDEVESKFSFIRDHYFLELHFMAI